MIPVPNNCSTTNLQFSTLRHRQTTVESLGEIPCAVKRVEQSEGAALPNEEKKTKRKRRGNLAEKRKNDERLARKNAKKQRERNKIKKENEREREREREKKRKKRKREKKEGKKSARRVGCVEEYRAQTPGNDRAGRPPRQLGYNITAACFTASRRVRWFGLKFLDRRDGGPWENWRVRRRWVGGWGARQRAKNYMNF